jgi:Ca2+-binding RTX toxin-like protein
MAIISGNNADNALNGNAEDDRIVCHGGNDTINGNQGNDFTFWRYGDGDDIIEDGDHFDTARFDGTDGPGDNIIIEDVIVGGNTFTRVSGDGFSLFSNLISNVERTTVSGKAGDDAIDRLLGEFGKDILDGGARDDFLSDDEGDYALDGNDGQDVLIGADGNDELNGGSGALDILLGLDGYNQLNGQTGDVVMTAGAGNDVFVFTPNFNPDKVMDFEDGSDRLRFFKAGVSNITDLTISDLNGDLLISVTDAPQNDVLLVGLAGAFLDPGDLVFLPSSETGF